jgi:hypothetical protein
LAEGVNAGVCPGGGARLDEVGDRDRGQHTDDTQYDHYLHKRKARFFRRLDFHKTNTFVLKRREQGSQRIIYDYFFVHLLPVTNRLSRNLAGSMPECPLTER